MITDEERREVARRLREFSKDKWPLTVGGNSATIRYAISDIVFNDKRYHSGVDLFNRLADLIEPSCDRDALLALSDEIYDTSCDNHGELTVDLIDIWGWSQAICEALEVQDA